MEEKSTYRLVKFQGQEYLHVKDWVTESLYTVFGFVNGWQSYAAIRDGDVNHFGNVIGKVGDLEFVRDVSDPNKEFQKYRLDTKDADITEWVGKTLVEVRELESKDSAFWGDQTQMFLFRFKDGSTYLGKTYGGSSLFGLGGSQYHGFSIEKVLNPELLNGVK